MEKRDLAITIQNLVQFYSMKNGIDALIKKGYSVDIYTPFCEDSCGFGDMFNATYDYLINMGYSPIRNSNDSLSYKILLEPYPMDSYIKLNYKYRLKYKYSLLSAKPNLVYIPENNLYYDAILCFGQYEANFLRAYSNVEVIGNLKYENLSYLDKPKTDKPVLLYLPTYGNVSSIDSIIKQLIKLKDSYYIIVKLHHGTSFLKDEKERIDKIKNICDESHDHTTELVELLSKADVVLSDNSGAIFETLYAKVPLAIYSEDINKNKLEDFDTIQYKLVQDGYIPYTSNPQEIPSVLKQALSNEYIKKQVYLSNKFFYHPNNPIDCFVNIIEKYLNDKLNLDYKKIHDVLINEFINKDNNISYLKNKLNVNNSELLNTKSELTNLKNELIHTKEANEELSEQINDKLRIISYYENGKLYKICKKIYQLYYKLFRRSKK